MHFSNVINYNITFQLYITLHVNKNVLIHFQFIIAVNETTNEIFWPENNNSHFFKRIILPKTRLTKG